MLAGRQKHRFIVPARVPLWINVDICVHTDRPQIGGARKERNRHCQNETERRRVQLHDNMERDSTDRRAVTVATVNQFLLTLITKRLYEDLDKQEMLWRVAGYLGNLDNKTS
jgi:hypothetical protein